jgi:hypothetical protein
MNRRASSTDTSSTDDYKKPTRRGFLKRTKNLAINSALVLAAGEEIGLFTNEWHRTGNDTRPNLDFVDRYGFTKLGADKLDQLDIHGAPMELHVVGTDSRDVIAARNSQTQDIDPKRGHNEILILNPDFGKKAILAPGGEAHTIGNFTQQALGIQNNHLLLDKSLFEQHDFVDITAQENDDVTLHFRQNGTDPKQGPHLTIKRQLTSAFTPTVSRLSVLDVNGAPVTVSGDTRLNTMKDWRNAIDAAFNALGKIGRETPSPAPHYKPYQYDTIPALYAAQQNEMQAARQEQFPPPPPPPAPEISQQEKGMQNAAGMFNAVLEGRIEADNLYLQKVFGKSRARLAEPDKSTTVTVYKSR